MKGMTRYYKATRPDGRDFFSGTVDYAAALGSGELVTHPEPRKTADGYLSVSVSAADCTGMEWPCRLFEVVPIDPWTPEIDEEWFTNKRACHSLRVVRELPAHEALGPQGIQVAALVDKARSLTPEEADRLAAAWAAARPAARAAWAAAAQAAQWADDRSAARSVAQGAARAATRDANRSIEGGLWYGIWDAARALIDRDLISPEHFETLTEPWRTAIGPIY